MKNINAVFSQIFSLITINLITTMLIHSPSSAGQITVFKPLIPSPYFLEDTTHNLKTLQLIFSDASAGLCQLNHQLTQCPTHMRKDILDAVILPFSYAATTPPLESS